MFIDVIVRSKWEALSDTVKKRVDLSTSGHTHLTSYADDSTTFDLWLSGAEKKQAASSIPGYTLANNMHVHVHEVFKPRDSQSNTIQY